MVAVTLVCENEVMKGVIDAFVDIKVKLAGKGWFQTTVNVCMSPAFYAWVFQWSEKVKIDGPEKASEKYRKMDTKVL